MALNFPPSPNTGDTYLCWEWDGDKWVRIPGVTLTVGDTAPDDPIIGSMWFDTDGDNLYVWDGGQWQLANAGASVGPNSPSDPNAGNIWYNTANGNTYIWDGSQWQPLTGTAASNTDPPSDPAPGTLWFDPNGGALYVYYSAGGNSSWVGTAIPCAGAGGP